jgi:hypothetical protein
LEKKALDMIANMEDSKVDKTGSLMEWDDKHLN